MPVKALQGERVQIGNNRGGINGWITRRQIVLHACARVSRSRSRTFACVRDLDRERDSRPIVILQ
jgi:hypothetical protein